MVFAAVPLRGEPVPCSAGPAAVQAVERLGSKQIKGPGINVDNGGALYAILETTDLNVSGFQMANLLHTRNPDQPPIFQRINCRFPWA